METGSSPRPTRRRAHVCRVCNSEFTCKAELLEHEQETHTLGSATNSTLSAKRRLGPVLSVGPESGRVSLVKLDAFAKKTSLNGNQPASATAVPVNLLVDHEEVYESCWKVKSTDTVVQASAADAAMSVQQKSASTGSSGVAQQTDSALRVNRQASSVHGTARQHDQVSTEDVSGFVPSTDVVTQSSESQSQQPSQSDMTTVQNRGPSSAVSSCLIDKGVQTNMSPERDVIQALGLKRKGGATDVTMTSSDTTDVDDDDDTKPPISDSDTDLCGTAVDSRHMMRYEVLGSINEERSGSDSDVAARRSGDIAMQSALLPALTKEEAADCVAGLHQGASFTEAVNNDELQLLAAVSSTRSRDIVAIEPERPSDIPAPQEQQQHMTDIVMADPTDIVEQEVVLETSVSDSEPRRLSGRPTKKHTSVPKSPVCVVKLPMTPRQFTSTDGAKKRMVAITVARAPRMVSVLLRNRGNAGTEEQQEQQESAAEGHAEQPTEMNPESETTNSNAETSSDAVVEPATSDNLSAETATAVQSIAVSFVASGDTESNAANEAQKPKIEVCLYCDIPLPADEISEHIMIAHVCQYCGRKFRQPMNLRKHVKLNHENVKPHCCPICSKAFPYASYLSEHMQVHGVEGEERRHACELCNKSFMRASGLRKHTKEEHLDGPKPFECPHCDRRYVYRCALAGHMRRHSALRPFSCQTCGAGFKHISNLQKHVKKQHPEPCPVCGDITATCDHAETERALKSRHRCAKCARMFESAAALHVHERVHTGEKPEVCEVCGRAFQHRSNLQKHMMKHAGRRPHACTFCPRAFYARHSLLAHMRKHTGESPYRCETCGKCFCTKNSLQVHINLHNDIRPYACDTCGRGFAQLGNLQKHMSVHTGERPHKCPKCTRCFSDISAMRRHCAAIHDKDARYGCDLCGKRFLHLSSARSHRMQHDGTKPFRCEFCSKTFSHRSGWLRHRRVHRHTDPNGVVRAVVGEGQDSKEVVLKPGEYIVYLTE